ncbi:MAG: fibronectin type III domain-containing protein [Spirochaetales bacterium]|nr:fibronectin type III domain-containing protein [Spirochaetales bacterium]
MNKNKETQVLKNKFHFITFFIIILLFSSCYLTSNGNNSTDDDSVATPSGEDSLSLTAGDSSILASWISDESCTAYQLWYNTTDDSSTAEQYGDDLTSTTKVISDLTNGTTYYVWVNYKYDNEESSYSASYSATPVGTPNAPTLTAAYTEIQVNWEATEGAESYYVYYNTEEDTSTAVQFGDILTSTSVTITELSSTTTYYIWVQAVNSSGTSNFSDSAKTTLPTSASIPDAVSYPTLTAGDSKLTVTWDAAAGATSYQVWYSIHDNTNTATQFGSNFTTTSCTITGLTNYNKYYVWIKSVGVNGESDFGASSSATPPSTDSSTSSSDSSSSIAAPSAPTLAAGNTKIEVTWHTVSNAESYLVYFSIHDNTDTATQFGSNFTTTSCTITDLDNYSKYYVWIRAVNSSGTSNFSPSSSATPDPSTVVTTPSAPTLTAGNAQIDVSWDSVSDAESYLVYYSIHDNTDTVAQFGTNFTTTSCTITGLTNYNKYYVWIKAVNNSGTSNFSASSSTTPGL